MEHVTTAMNDMGRNLARISTWVDSSRINADRPAAEQLLVRVSKVQEECGEVCAALVGYMGSNPRKGYTHSLDDIEKELLDTAATALAAVEHLHRNDGSSGLRLVRHVEFLHHRAGLDEE